MTHIPHMKNSRNSKQQFWSHIEGRRSTVVQEPRERDTSKGWCSREQAANRKPLRRSHHAVLTRNMTAVLVDSWVHDARAVPPHGTAAKDGSTNTLAPTLGSSRHAHPPAASRAPSATGGLTRHASTSSKTVPECMASVARRCIQLSHTHVRSASGSSYTHKRSMGAHNLPNGSALVASISRLAVRASSVRRQTYMANAMCAQAIL